MRNATIAREARFGVVLALVAAACLVPCGARAQSPGLMTRVSRSSAGVDGDRSSGRAAISADGRFVAFDSSATNLVPGDTNDDSDVFVHDASTGVIERVSVTWNGMEARDDSECPAISADGRYVAFLSAAWNMYPGGANLGHPRADVYLHDRQTHTTTHVSRAVDGSDPNAPSQCPSISADGRRVVFASSASNLVRNDDNQTWDVFLFDADKQKIKLVSRTAEGGPGDGASWNPRISGDGSAVAFLSVAGDLDGASRPPAPPFGRITRVLVRDLAAGTTEFVDVTALQPGEPNEQPSEVAISGDGRVVAFSSYATNLVADAPLQAPYVSNVFVRDRAAGRTVLASRRAYLIADCWEGPETGRCNDGSAGLPSVSGDGRWVSFTSYSQQLMPLTYWFTSEVYVFDMLGHRLRRVSLDPTGWETDCNGDSSLSGDGSVIAITGNSGLLPQFFSRGRHVYRNEWQRTPAGRRRPTVACPPKPASCTPAEGAVFRLRKSAPRSAHEDRLFWRWNGPADATPLPDGAAGARYQLCVYDGADAAVAMDVGTPAARACPDSGAPCWGGSERHRALRDQQGALTTLTLHRGSGSTRILARGRGLLLDAPYLPRPAAQGLTVQLQETTSGRCWSADFPAEAIGKNFSGLPGTAGGSDGWLVARLP